MPTSRRTTKESQADGGSVAGSGKAKRKPKPTKPAAHRKKKVKARYAKAREEAQLAGVIPTTPDGAVHEERVPLCAQSEDSKMTAVLVSLAIRNGWEVPKRERERFVDELASILTNAEMSPKMKVAAFNALRLADKDQWERDHPEEAGKAKGANVGVSVQANMLAVTVLRGMFENEQGRGETALPPPIESSPLGPGRFDGEVEVGAASTGDQ